MMNIIAQNRDNLKPSALNKEMEENQANEDATLDSNVLGKIINSGLAESIQKIEIQRRDPKSPLYSVKSFEALHLKPNLLKGVYNMGFNAPSHIQETALPTLLADPPQNMIAQSQSGTGKTAAFILAMLSRVDTTKTYPQIICLTPTYELAIQIGEVATIMARFSPDITMRYIVRGERLLVGNHLTEHILIGTPGKMMDWSLKLKYFDLKKISLFVLDEADIMIGVQGHQDQCIRIHRELSPNCQMLLFSATYDKTVMDFAELIVPNPTMIRLLREEETLDNIKQFYIICNGADAKYVAIENIYSSISIGQAMIFCQTRQTAHWLAGKMVNDGHAVAVLSGELTVEERITILDRFRDGKEKVLITTNVLSRGIDIEQVTVVVNFDLPYDLGGKADFETYLHRIGRTGRFGKHGFAFNLVQSQQDQKICADIEKHFKKEIKLLETENYEVLEKLGQPN